MSAKGRPSESGSALAIVLVMMMVMMILLTVMLQIDAGQARFNPRHGDKVEAFHYAEAGVNRFLWAANKGTVSTDITFDAPITYLDGVYEISSVQDTEAVQKIQAIGYPSGQPNLKRVLDVTIAKRAFTQYAQLMENMSGAYYATGEKLYGPIHSNGDLLVTGSPEFFGPVTYVNSISSGAAPIYHQTPKKVSKLEFPLNNSVIKDFAKATGGYYYTGRTLIYLKKTGGMTVVNKGIKQNVALPANGVIYVDGTARDSKNVESDAMKFDLDRGNLFVSGWLDGQLTIAAANDIYITSVDPTNNDLKTATTTQGIRYANTDFSLDTSSGVVTVNGSSKVDMLGLVANNNVWLMTKGYPLYTNSNIYETGDSSTKNDMFVYGAIFAINHQYASEDISLPKPQKKLVMRGAIISKEIGVTQDDTKSGYTYDLAHDPRMLYDTPPKFINPVNSGWEIIDWRESN